MTTMGAMGRGWPLVAIMASALAMPLAAQTAASSTPGKTASAPEEDEDDATTVSAVTVTPKKPYSLQYGAVVGDIQPELQYNPAEIQSFGVSTVTDLLNELAPETRSDRGRGGETPVVLLNGRRISSLNEIQNIPTEAILRVDILPEEVSLKYGYTANQRVVNIVLRRYFHATTAEAQGGGPTEGGEVTDQAELDLLHIRRDNRLNLDLKYHGASGVTDAARSIIEPAPMTPYDLIGNVASATPGAQIDPALSALAGRPVTVAGIPMGTGNQPLTLGDFAPTAGVPNTTNIGHDRSLAPATQSLTANAVYATPIFAGIRATFNATLAATSSDSLQGLPGIGLDVPAGNPFSPFGSDVVTDRYVNSPLHQYVTGWTAHLGSTFNKDLGPWRLSLTDAYDHADTQTDTDAGIDPARLQALINQGSTSFSPFGPLPPSLIGALPQAVARSVSDSANIQILANGPVIKLPAGNLYVSAKAGDTQSWLGSTSTRMNQFQSVYLTRNDGNAQLNVDVPLTSRRNKFLAFMGELSINANAAVDQVSEFGTLRTFGYGVNWTPKEGYNLIVSRTNDQVAPTIQQLANPMVDTPNVRVFDYATGQTVDVTQVTGGNPALTHDNRNVTKIGLTLKPFSEQDFTFTANYIRSDIDNAIQTFPAASAAIEAAFPDRFVRDDDGELVLEDVRAVNFAKADRSELRWGINYSRPVGKKPPPRPLRRALIGPDGQPLLRRVRPDRSAAAPESSGGAPADDNGPSAAGSPGGPAAGQTAGGPTPDTGGGYRGGERGSGFGGGGGGGGRGGRGRFGAGGPAPGGRLQIAVYHTIYFTDRMLVRPGGPTLDLLNGAPASGAGGQYRNEVEGQLGITLAGLGARLSADWREATLVTGAIGSPTGNLLFSGLTTLNFRLWDNLGQQRPVVKRFPWLSGTRITLYVGNLLDERVQVRDAAGATPLSYQPGYLDPVGRTITLSIRKLFY